MITSQFHLSGEKRFLPRCCLLAGTVSSCVLCHWTGGCSSSPSQSSRISPAWPLRWPPLCPPGPSGATAERWNLPETTRQLLEEDQTQSGDISHLTTWILKHKWNCLTRTSLPQTYQGSVLNPLVISSPNCQPHGCCRGLRLTANAVSSMLPSLCPQSSQFPSPAFLVDFLQPFNMSYNLCFTSTPFLPSSCFPFSPLSPFSAHFSQNASYLETGVLLWENHWLCLWEVCTHSSTRSTLGAGERGLQRQMRKGCERKCARGEHRCSGSTEDRLTYRGDREAQGQCGWSCSLKEVWLLSGQTRRDKDALERPARAQRAAAHTSETRESAALLDLCVTRGAGHTGTVYNGTHTVGPQSFHVWHTGSLQKISISSCLVGRPVA